MREMEEERKREGGGRGRRGRKRTGVLEKGGV
jgi:hypothetical protein